MDFRTERMSIDRREKNYIVKKRLPREDTDVIRKFSKAPHGRGAKKKTSETQQPLFPFLFNVKSFLYGSDYSLDIIQKRRVFVEGFEQIHKIADEKADL